MSNIDREQLKKDWSERFSKATDAELKDILARERKNPGWVGVRALYLQLLREEFEKRGMEYK